MSLFAEKIVFLKLQGLGKGNWISILTDTNLLLLLLLLLFLQLTMQATVFLHQNKTICRHGKETEEFVGSINPSAHCITHQLNPETSKREVSVQTYFAVKFFISSWKGKHVHSSFVCKFQEATSPY